MRRIASSGLVGLGAFLIVAAGLIKFYAYPALAKVPTNYESTTQLEAQDAKLYDANTGNVITVDLNIESYTVADSSVSAGDGNVVWINRASITRGDIAGASCAPDASADALLGCFQQSTEISPFDAVTGAGVSIADCGCKSVIETSDPITGDVEPVETNFVGQVLKFPFNTQKRDYDQWDSTTGRAWPAVYSGQETLNGLKVYKFVQTIPDTVVPGNPVDGGTRPVPGAIFGLDDATVDANYLYSVTRTFYIEPVTGAPVNRVEQRNQRLILGDDVSTAQTALDGTIQYTDAQVSDFTKDAKSKAFMLNGLKLMFPLIALLLGLIALGTGIMLGRRKDEDAGAGTDHRVLANA